MASGDVEVCSNCGKEMLRSEQAYIFEDRIVCADCYTKLREGMGDKEYCAECGRRIREFEKAYVVDGHLLCLECEERARTIEESHSPESRELPAPPDKDASTDLRGVEVCANCGKEIPRSEQAYIFKDRIVCAECDKKFRKLEMVSNKKRPKVIVAMGFIIAVVGLVSFLYFHFFGSNVDLVIREIPLGKSPQNIKNIVVSDNRKRVAISDRDRNGKKMMFVVDGVEGKKYDDSLWLDPMLQNEDFLFSPDSQRYMYKARRDRKNLVVIDGIEQKEYDSVDELTFSPDSKRTAYTAKIGEMWRTVVDGIEGNAFEVYPHIGDLVFSPTGQVVYSAVRGRKWVMVVGGIEGKAYDNIGEGDPAFSPDGKRLAYAAKRGQEWLMVIDGSESNEFDGISEAVFSPDSKRVMFAALENNKHYVIIDGEIGTGYDAVAALTFSPDSKRTAYVAKYGKKWLVVVDSIEQEVCNGITDLAFSLDSRHFAYLAKRDEKGFLVMDFVEQRKYDGAHLLTFSPDGKCVAFCANVGRKQVTLEEDDYETINMPVVIGKDPWGFPRIENRPTKFPNAKGQEKLEKTSGKLLVVVNGNKERTYDVVANLTFSPDSKRYVYWAHDGEEWMIVVNGFEGGKYDSLISGPMQSRSDNRLRYYLAGKLISYPGSKFVFDTPTTFHTLARRDRKIFRIEVEIVTD